MRTSGGVAGPTSTSAERHSDAIIETMNKLIIKVARNTVLRFIIFISFILFSIRTLAFYRLLRPAALTL